MGEDRGRKLPLKDYKIISYERITFFGYHYFHSEGV